MPRKRHHTSNNRQKNLKKIKNNNTHNINNNKIPILLPIHINNGIPIYHKS
jgi:hypothetical protein